MPYPPLAYAPDGRLLATAEGSLLLVYDGDSEEPLFTSELDGHIVSIAIDAGHLFALSSRGLLRELDARGARVNEWSTNAGRGVVAAGGRVCVYGPKATLFHGGERRDLDVERVSAAALSADGRKLLVCTELGTAQIFDTPTGALAGASKASGPFAGAAWSASGHFIATVQARAGGIDKVDPTNAALSPFIGTGAHRLDSVSASEDGCFVAARVEDGRILMFDAAGTREVGNLVYGEPETPGVVAFGPSTWLAVAIGHGDANKIDLSTRAVHRTDPHEGRPRHSWTLRAKVDVDRVAAVLDGGDPSGSSNKRKLGLFIALVVVVAGALISLLGR